VAQPPLIVAHKGASAYAVGNSAEALSLAIRLGADAIELDVQLTSDNHLVVYDKWFVHDGGRQFPVVESTLAQVRRLAEQTVSGATFLTLPEALGMIVPTRLEVLVELKNSRMLQPLLLGERVHDDLREAGMLNRSYMFSFDHQMIAHISHRDDVRKGILYVARLVNLAETLRLTGSSFVETRNDFLDRCLVDDLHRMGVTVCGWATDEEQELRRLSALGVDMVTVNAPDLARQAIGNQP